jgi:bacterioferritin-associated ferredoxin
MCGTTGALVKSKTVESLVNQDIDEGSFKYEIFSLCMDKTCEMVYFSADYGYLYLQRDVVMPIDFKEDAEIKYACYCHQITIDDVRKAVLKHHASSVKDIFMSHQRIIVEKCQSNNPIGCSCMADIKKMIEEIKLGLSGEL